MVTTASPFNETALRALRAVANHPGSTPQDVAERAFNHGNVTRMTGSVSTLLRHLHKEKLLKRGYVIIYRQPRARAVNYTYFLSRRGFEALKFDERAD